MPDSSTRRSTPPQSTRIGQPVQTSATVVPAYADTDFPSVAFTNQLAIDLTTKSLAYFDANGAWQGVVSSSGVQTFYGPVPPVAVNLSDGDRWFDTATGIWNVWNASKSSWMPGNAAYSSQPPTNPTIGQAWYDTATQTLYFWNGSDWVLGTDPTAPGIYTGAMPAAAVAGSSWTDPNGIQYVCITTYTSGGSLDYWVQITIGADPLVGLITQNGQLIQAQEIDTTNVYAGPSTQVPITTGLVWLDITDGAPTEGDYFVYTGTEWRVVTAPSTLVLCAGLRVSQNAQGIIGTNLNYIWPDPLASLVTLNSSFASGTGSANSAAPGPVVLANVSAVSVASNIATINVDTTGGFLAGRSISVQGLATTALNSTWTLSQVIPNTEQLVFAAANVADIASTADAGTATLQFAIGDVAEDPVLNEWFIWDQTANVTNTWADWVMVQNPSTVALCATIATQVLPELLSSRCVAVGRDVATGQYQNIPADLNAAFQDVLAIADVDYQAADIALSNYTIASGSYVQDSILYFVGSDQPVLANVAPVGVALMNTSSAQDAQVLISVTDSGWTGTATKIQSANFLATYATARGTL